MARKPRVELDGTFYHMICRGNRRQTINEVMPIGSTTWTGWNNIDSGTDTSPMREALRSVPES